MFSLFFLFVFFSASGHGEEKNIPDKNALSEIEKSITIQSVADIDVFRKKINLEIFGSSFLPSGAPEIYETDLKRYPKIGEIVKEMDGRENFLAIQTFAIKMPVAVSDDDLVSVSHFLKPRRSNGCVVLYCQGHKGNAAKYGKPVIQVLLEAGFAVFIHTMPLFFPNTRRIVTYDGYEIKIGEKYHDSMKRLKELEDGFPGQKHPLYYFTAPLVKANNYFTSKGYTIYALGLSGGGWTVTVVSGLDDRVYGAYTIAAVFPLRLLDYYGMGKGDYEESEPLFLSYDYTNLYIAAATGEGGMLMIYNHDDSCCYRGRDYLRAPWAPVIRDRLIDMEYPGDRFGVRVVDHDKHSISRQALEAVFDHMLQNNPELKIYPVDLKNYRPYSEEDETNNTACFIRTSNR